MERREETIGTIVGIEWEMMDKVQNCGGRAHCQDDWETFRLMRTSQMRAWNQPMLDSYLDDLRSAQTEGRNLLCEKYAYMMERTNPAEYAALRGFLPVPSLEKEWLADWICREHVRWQEELAAQYPVLASRGRDISRSADRQHAASFETYLRGALLTYSVETLRLYAAYVEKLQKAGRNMNRMILEDTIGRCGYPSLEAAEQRLSGAGLGV